jgi:hypothetical protein
LTVRVGLPDHAPVDVQTIIDRAGGMQQLMARLDTGDPFLVEKKFGEGRIIECAVPCDAEWTNLPARPFYLPLMQQTCIEVVAWWPGTTPGTTTPAASSASHPRVREAGHPSSWLGTRGRRPPRPCVGKGLRFPR